MFNEHERNAIMTATVQANGINQNEIKYAQGKISCARQANGCYIHYNVHLTKSWYIVKLCYEFQLI